jgi:hypothetical protein
MLHNTTKRSEKEVFLDNYFYNQLVQVIIGIDKPQIGNRQEHVRSILDSLMNIADEYQSVMAEGEEGYWPSLELWDDKCSQEAALNFINYYIQGEQQN